MTLCTNVKGNIGDLSDLVQSSKLLHLVYPVFSLRTLFPPSDIN